MMPYDIECDILLIDNAEVQQLLVYGIEPTDIIKH